MNVQVYELISQRIIGLLTQGTVPWHKPWTVRTGMPRNLVTQKPYRGINVFLLLALRYESPLWLTYRQALRFGGNVRKCEKSCPVVSWKKTTIEDEAQDEPKEIRLLRLYHVFNAAQCEGLNSVSAPVVTPLSNALKPAEIVNRMPQAPVIKHGMAHAYYSPRTITLECRPASGFSVRKNISPRCSMNWFIRPQPGLCGASGLAH